MKPYSFGVGPASHGLFPLENPPWCPWGTASLAAWRLEAAPLDFVQGPVSP